MIEAEDIESPLRDDTDYFDATKAIKAIENSLGEQFKRLDALTLAMQRQLLINGQLINQLKQALTRLNELEGKPKSALILPEHLQ